MSGLSRLILVVDDSEDCAATLDIALGAIAGWTVRAATTAEQALEVLETETVAAMITDLHLPAMDGLELVRRVRWDGRWTNIPILVISGDSDPATPERARRAGAAAFFGKPYSPVAVRQKVEELIDAQ